MNQSTFFDNRTVTLSGVIVPGSDIDVDVTNSIFHESQDYSFWCNMVPVDWAYTNTYSDVGATFPISCTLELVDCLELDPLFQASSSDNNPLNDNLQLQPLSPCVDSGDPTCTDPDNTVCDMGAYGGPDPLS